MAGRDSPMGPREPDERAMNCRSRLNEYASRALAQLRTSHGPMSLGVRLLRRPQVEEMTGSSRSSISRLMQEEASPWPLRSISTHVVTRTSPDRAALPQDLLPVADAGVQAPAVCMAPGSSRSFTRVADSAMEPPACLLASHNSCHIHLWESQRCSRHMQEGNWRSSTVTLRTIEQIEDKNRMRGGGNDRIRTCDLALMKRPLCR